MLLIRKEMSTSMEKRSLQTEFLNAINENKGIIYKVCSIYAKNPEDRKDLVQEVFINIWDAIPRFQQKSKVSTWIYRIALNTAISSLRKANSNHINLEYGIPVSIQIKDDFDEEIFDQVYNSINKLGRVEKAIIMLWLDNYSYDEIAEIIGITRTNVGTKLNRIKEQLKYNMNKM